MNRDQGGEHASARQRPDVVGARADANLTVGQLRELDMNPPWIRSSGAPAPCST